MPEYDPEERFSIYPLSGEEALQRVLGTEDEGDEDVDAAPEEGETDS